jgi:aldose 1-epimerase
MTNPSGEQYWLEVDGQEACVVEVGGGLRTYTVDGVDVLDGYGVDEIASGGRGQLLLPWPNRIQDGKYTFAGQELQLALTEPGRHHAIHGLVRWANWMATVNDGDRVVMEHVLHPQPGYPFTLGLSVEYRLGAGGLSVETTATNLGSHPCPYGAGAHPYLTVGTEQVDDVVLTLPASEYIVADERGIPRERRLTVRSPFRFFQTMRIGELELDTAFGGLTGNEAVIASPDGQRRVRLWWDDAHQWVMVFTGDTLDPSRRRRSVAVEPMTCPPNAFVSGEGLRVLEPEESWTTAWGIEANRAR